MPNDNEPLDHDPCPLLHAISEEQKLYGHLSEGERSIALEARARAYGGGYRGHGSFAEADRARESEYDRGR